MTVVIALIEFALSKSLGLTIRTNLVLSTSMWSALAKEFATEPLVSANVLMDTKGRHAPDSRAPTTALDTELANTLRTPSSGLLGMIIPPLSSRTTRRPSHTLGGTSTVPENASATPCTAMSTAQRKCALTEPMSWITETIFC